jgi:hypothetical protein
MTESDTTTMTGAELRRYLGTDPERWAAAFVRAGDRDGWLDAVRDERVAYATQWFRDAMDAAAARAKWDTQGDCLKLIDTLVRSDEEPPCPPTP